MSTNQLNDISKVYLNQIAEETPAERIDRISKANVAKQKEKSDADKAARAKKTAEFQKHKASVISRGGRPVDALDSWHKKQAHKEALELRTEKKEVNVKDTYKTVAAIVDYDRAKKGSEYATYDSEHGKKKEAKKERDYAAWERSKMKKDDPKWQHKKYHTGMHGEGYQRNPEAGEAKERADAKKREAIPGQARRGMPPRGDKKREEFEKWYAQNVRSSYEPEGEMIEDAKYGYDKKGNSLNPADIEARKKKEDKLFGAPRVKKEGLSDWRTDLSSLIEIVAEPEDKAEKEVVEKKVKNKVIINPKFTEAVEEMGGELLEMTDLNEIVESYEEEIEAAVEYFCEEGINDEGLEAIIEEVGLDTFVEFVTDAPEFLDEDWTGPSGRVYKTTGKTRHARKMNVKTKKKMPDTVAKDAAAEAKRKAGKTGEYAEAPKKKAKVGTPGYTTTVKAEPKKKAAPKPAAKKVVAVTKQVKKLQPKKEVSKDSIRDRVKSAFKAGVKRHKKAVQPARVFAKGVKAGAKSAVKFAGKAAKAISGSYELEGEMIAEKSQVKKELKALKKGAETLKGKNIAKADEVEESYEDQKTKEVVGALDREKPGKRKKPLPPAQKKEIAAKVVKDKGDTTKSDDRYAYEEKNWIQKATKNMRKDKPCTGEKFGSESCPPGTKRYNLAKTFRKMAKEGLEAEKKSL